jgi:hypothetical protein
MSVRPELVRIGDRERAAAAERLSAHAAAGRISISELEQRLERAHAAVFARDLHALEADLPAPVRRPEPRRPRPFAALAIAVLLAAVLATALVGHPIPPLFIAAFLLWRLGAHRGRPSVSPT